MDSENKSLAAWAYKDEADGYPGKSLCPCCGRAMVGFSRWHWRLESGRVRRDYSRLWVYTLSWVIVAALWIVGAKTNNYVYTMAATPFLFMVGRVGYVIFQYRRVFIRRMKRAQEGDGE